MTDAYDALTKAVTDAGFFTNGIEDLETWHRTCIASKRIDGRGVFGNSFWVSRARSRWYLGVWGGPIYRLADENRLAELCISWLTRVPNGTASDFDNQLKQEFGLFEVSPDEFEEEEFD